MSLLNRLDRIPLSRPHCTLLLMGGLGYTFDGMDAAIVAFLLPSVKTVGPEHGPARHHRIRYALRVSSSGR